MRLVLKQSRSSPKPPPPPMDAPVLSEVESLDTIIQKTRPGANRQIEKLKEELQDRLAALEVSESQLNDEKRQLLLDKSELAERERFQKEEEMLLEARIRVISEKEAQLGNSSYDPEMENKLTALQMRIEQSSLQLSDMEELLKEKDSLIGNLEADLSSVKATQETTTKVEINSLEEISDPSLEDQTLFLQEREAFIEQSENTLFEKAQSLQEWETRLQQLEDDLKAISKRSGSQIPENEFAQS